MTNAERRRLDHIINLQRRQAQKEFRRIINQIKRDNPTMYRQHKDELEAYYRRF